jgi:hypothetical protein
LTASVRRYGRAVEWSWLKRYRAWRASRKEFLSPENWLEPELRDDKGPSFTELTSLPGHELVLAGLDDLARGVESQESLLVSIGAPRLRAAGIDVPEPFDSPEHRLYDRLAAEDPDSAHGRYNALVRRLVSFERAADGLVRADVDRG